MASCSGGVLRRYLLGLVSAAKRMNLEVELWMVLRKQ